MQRVRCFKCGEEEAVQVMLMGKEIMQAKCESCHTDLLAEVDDLRERVERGELESEREASSDDPEEA